MVTVRAKIYKMSNILDYPAYRYKKTDDVFQSARYGMDQEILFQNTKID